ncbi:MAG: helix-turn-helix domain-containing protein [Candidatus Binatus sp.]|jgi:Mor family transcriptional regulator|uniref:helix-turn-helix domain-containing protein n=1 Tax=Candidatus Binatus sp. TaxID=2811406 RepID=UPI003D146B22
MNVVHSRMPALNRAPSQAPAFDLFPAAARTSLYDQIGHSIGADAADKLIADFGGRRLYIPVAPGPGDLITRSIGLSAAMEMARVFGGDRLLIPVTTDHARRRVQIVAMRADHVSISRIAHELRCTERYVYKVLALYRAPDARCAESAAPTSAPIAERLKRGPINQRS